MLNFIKKIFGSKPAEVKVPYKVEASATPKAEKATSAAKKPTVKKATARKPRAPKA